MINLNRIEDKLISSKKVVYSFLFLIVFVCLPLILFRFFNQEKFDCSDIEWSPAYLLGKPKQIDKISIGEARFFVNKALECGIKGKLKDSGYYLDLALETDHFYLPAIGTRKLLDRINATAHKGILAKRMFKGVYYLCKKNYNKAILEYKNAIRMDSNFTPAYTDMSIAYISLKEYDRAIEALNTAIKINPEYPETHFFLGTCYAQKGDADRMLLEYRKAIALSPFYGPVHYSLGMYYYASKKYGLAAYHLKKTEKLTDCVFSKEISDFMNSHSDTENSDIDYEKIDVKGAKNHTRNGTRFALDGNVRSAKEEFQKAITCDKFYSPAIGKLRVADKAIQGQISKEAAIYEYKGMDYMERNMFDEAIVEMKKAIAIAPDSSAAYTDIGNCYMAKGMIKEAIEVLKKAVEFGPQFPVQRFLLGICYQQEGLAEQSVIEIKKALVLDPDFIPARYALAWYYYAKKDIPLAIEYYESIQRPEIYGYEKLPKLNELKELLATFKGSDILEGKNPAEFDFSDMKWAVTHIAGVDKSCSIRSVRALETKGGEGSSGLAEATLHTNNALAFAVEGDFKSSDVELKKALAADPFYSPAVGLSKMVGRAVRGEKRLDTSRHIARAIFYLNKVNYPAAVVELKKSLAIESDNFLAYTDLATCYLLMNRIDEAIVELNRALQKYPVSCNTGMSHFILGVCYQKKGKSSLAIKEFNKASTYNPKFALPYNNLAYEYFRLGQLDLALLNATKAQDLGYEVGEGLMRDIIEGRKRNKLPTKNIKQS